MYMPKVESVEEIDKALLGPAHGVHLYGNITSAGMVQYRFIVAVVEVPSGAPVYFVASEKNEMDDGGRSHVLGVFVNDGHLNLGASDEWADPRRFFPRAIDLAAEHFGLPIEGKLAALRTMFADAIAGPTDAPPSPES